MQMNLMTPGSNLSSFISTANSIPMLTAEEEHALAVELRENGNLDAARRLILPHLRFVIHVARGYAGYGLQQADRIQEGNIGLMKAVKRFRSGCGCSAYIFCRALDPCGDS